ncbi:MAG: DUF4011 domain-containing protein [Clostridia bacterium]|nr:DUF4011 domain-containing protein [Clostridia bacterium]
MGKSIYTYYKERLVEISGSSKCLYLKNVTKKSAYDLGHILEGRDSKITEFTDFIFSGKNEPFTLIQKSEFAALVKNLTVTPHIKEIPDGVKLTGEELEALVKKNQKAIDNAEEKAIENELDRIKELKREAEGTERETGRHELFIGYPFVFGCIQQGSSKTHVKAPLLLFPVDITVPDGNTVVIKRSAAQKIQINPALILAYAQAKKQNLEDTELEFDNIDRFRSIKDIIDYLSEAHVRIDYQSVKNIFAYEKFKEPDDERTALAVRSGAVIGRFPLSNSIYNDYTELEKKNLTNDAICELLRTEKSKTPLPFFKKLSEKKKPIRASKTTNSYVVKMLDYAQSEVVKKVDKNGNMVIYGPPGTGKSQTIVNVITDAICKNKKVLVVSQKRAALDVVFNRLGPLNKKAMYIVDENKERSAFYERCLTTHQSIEAARPTDLDAVEREYNDIEAKINAELSELERISDLLNTKLDFGLSLSEMYGASYMLPKDSSEYALYSKLAEDTELLSLRYPELKEALFAIGAKDLPKIYYEHAKDRERNPLTYLILPSIDLRTLSEVKALVENVDFKNKAAFNTADYPYYRQVLAYFDQISDPKKLDSLVKMELKLHGGGGLFSRGEAKRIRQMYLETHEAIRAYVKEYDFLLRIMTRDGYIAIIDNILRGNYAYFKLLNEAINNYVATRDTARLISELDKNQKTVLNFAYKASTDYDTYLSAINSLMLVRIYHELIVCESESCDEFARMMDYENITSRIMKLKEEQLGIASKLCEFKNDKEYLELYKNAENNKDFLYQISKKQKYWPIRKTVEVYRDFMLSLFPCWLLSPENVSSILPLERNMFDVVIFDEASQVFIESTIPTIFRGKNIVVAGDSKQLRPSSTFMKRYLGQDPDAEDDYSVQAALEVESLLDLAVARYESANLTYHYRSRSQELIDFSNYAFYSTDLRVAPNVTKNLTSRPIERYKVNGKWIDRKNLQEAKKITELLMNIFKTRKRNESIGIITFNSDQQACIADTIDSEAAKNPEFRSFIQKEMRRFENGEDTSLFIKNLENVQGDERDIIIFSIAYAPNELGKLYTNFGALSTEGGENRLNVAITRAKSKIILVTSIEPEELKVEGSKNLGPKLLKNYLAYVRAVSDGNEEDMNAVLAELDESEARASEHIPTGKSTEEQIKDRLEKLGYTVVTNLGNRNNRISLAVYDEPTDRYLVGVELDKDAFKSSDSCLERDVYKPKFLESRGWTIVRVWCRDWWISPTRVVKLITTLAEENRKRLTEDPKKPKSGKDGADKDTEKKPRTRSSKAPAATQG